MLQGFKEFIMRGNVLDMAVGIIIGAGINGAGVARDAAMRGLNVLLRARAAH